ncbi:hypothetical protein [Sphingomonas panni]|uniref:hypothetical protein n=1 Tax=Sphingomonas panni TaxID=237612 RepID=UPI001F5B6AA3|nr:hypothetical protein [Sphingomonas panni]
MQVELIRFEKPEEKHWASAPFRWVMDNPGKSLLAAPVMLAGPAIVGVAGLVTAATALGGYAKSWWDGVDEVDVLPPEGRADLEEMAGQKLKLNVPYAVVRALDLVVEADRLQSVMVRRELAELLTYLRGELHLTSFKAYVRQANGGKVFVGGMLRGESEIAGFAGSSRETALAWSTETPSVPEGSARSVFVDQYPDVVAAARAARNGSFEASQLRSFDFGISAKAAKQAGIDAAWLSQYEIRIEASYA